MLASFFLGTSLINTVVAEEEENWEVAITQATGETKH